MLRAFLFGFIISMPIGPTTVLFCRMALQKQFVKAWMVALGVACADILLSYLAGMGSRLVTFFVNKMVSVFGDVDFILLFLYVVLGLILIIMGFFVWKRPLKVISDIQNTKSKNFPTFISAFLMTFLNPAAFVAFSTLVPFFGLHHLDYWGLALVFIGLGSIAWWTALFLVIQHFAFAQSRVFAHVHEIMAIVLFVLGGVSFARFFWLFLSLKT